MAERFFAEVPSGASRVTLVGSEAHHLGRVVRARVGDELVLFDGDGAEFAAQVLRVRRDTVELQILERREIDRELPCHVSLGVALPRGDRQRWLVEKAVELGVSEFTPLITRRGVAQPGIAAQKRLRRAVIEASKQCGRNRLMQIHDALALQRFIESAPEDAARWIAHPAAKDSPDSLPQLADPDRAAVWLAIGPEGGLTDDEVAAAVAGGWRIVGLGGRILRVETAAVALASWISLQAAARES
jgi:16S rRNA (uracil1498-N3)-methyltransferase